MNEVFNLLNAAASFQLQTPTFTTLLLVVFFIVCENDRVYMKKYGVYLVPFWCLAISLEGWAFVVFCTMVYFWASDRVDQLDPKEKAHDFNSTHGKLYERYGFITQKHSKFSGSIKL